jgi:uncharacterized membrane protein YedE/YeeE
MLRFHHRCLGPRVSIASSWLRVLHAGVLMLVGSRLAAGCTSGHGLSGMALLSINSFIMVPAMFAGAIATAFLFSETDTLRF